MSGPLDSISPTKIEKFDPNTTWGCHTAWWFHYVDGRVPPQDASMAVGEAVHKQIEHYLKTGEDVLGPIARPGKHIIDAVRMDVVEVEFQVPKTYAVEGIPISSRSKIDALTRKGVIDWKTTSDFAKYAKTAGQLRKSTQMLLYADATKGAFLLLPMIEISHVYFQTRGKKLAEKVEAFITHEQLTVGMEGVRVLVRQMKDVAVEKDVAKVEGNLRACDVGRGCPHRHICPHQKEVDPLASLLDRFRTTVVEVPPPTAAAAVLPPDAPKSDPAKAAEPLPDLTPQGVPAPLLPQAPAAEAPKKRGRPLKIKDESTPDAPPPAPKAETAGENKTPRTEVHVQTVTVRHGLTLNMGNYSSAKVEVEMSGTYANGTAEQAREMLGGRVYAAAMAEAAKYAAKPEEKK